MPQTNGSRSPIRWILYLALAAMALLHQDVFFWNDPSMVLGLPAGLSYHLWFCIAAAVLLALLVRYAWPRELDEKEEELERAERGADRP